MRPVVQESFWYRLLDGGMAGGGDCVCFRIDHAARCIRSRRGDLLFAAIERIWIRGSRARLLFGDRITYQVVITGGGRSYCVLTVRDRADAERIVAELGVNAPVERYQVDDTPAGPG